MTPLEFKAWFEGFTEALTGCPTKAQWARIKERVGQIDGQATTERIFVDRWWPSIQPYIPYRYPGWTYLSGSTGGGTALGNCQSSNMNTLHDGHEVDCTNARVTFSPVAAMGALGRAEAAQLND